MLDGLSVHEVAIQDVTRVYLALVESYDGVSHAQRRVRRLAAFITRTKDRGPHAQSFARAGQIYDAGS